MHAVHAVDAQLRRFVSDAKIAIMTEVKEPTLKFRNYIPKAPELRAFCLARPTTEALEKAVEKEIVEVIEAASTDVGFFCLLFTPTVSIIGAHMNYYVVIAFRMRYPE